MNTQEKHFWSIAELCCFLGRNLQCQGLIVYVHGLEDTPSTSPRRFHHANLAALSLFANNPGSVLDHLELPSLQHLRITYLNETPVSGMLPRDSLFDFVTVSNATIWTLSIDASIYDYRGISRVAQREVLRELSHLGVFLSYNGVVDVIDSPEINDILCRRREHWMTQTLARIQELERARLQWLCTYFPELHVCTAFIHDKVPPFTDHMQNISRIALDDFENAFIDYDQVPN